MSGKGRILITLLGAAVLCSVPTLAQDNVEGPYGTVNGDIYGRARMDAAVEQYAAGMELAWEIDVRAAGYDRCGGRTHPVFDAAGNIYWMTSAVTSDGYQHIASASPDGTLRWIATDWLSGSAAAFGNGGVVVGGQAVYGFPGGTAFDYDGDGISGWAAGAYDKATGARIWRTDLDGDWNNDGNPEASVDVNGVYHPVLYNGKLYILVQGTQGLGVFALDAATGALLTYNAIPEMVNTRAQAGTVTYVPDIFPAAGGGYDDGMFLNSGMWVAPHDVWGLRVKASGVTLEWKQSGGKNAGRSHVVYSSETGHLYAHTWWDEDWAGAGEGQGFGVYDAATGNILDSYRGGNHGYYDIATLGWNDLEVACGGFDGSINVYNVATDGTVDSVATLLGEPNWREPQWFGQLLKKDALDMDGVLLTGTYDGSAEAAPWNAEVVLLDLSQAAVPMVVDDAGVYIDDIEVLDGPDFDNLTLEFGENFDGGGWSTGPAVGQDPLWYDGGTVGPAVPQIVEDSSNPNLAPQGLMLYLDPVNEGDFPAAKWYFPYPVGIDLGNNVVVIRWKQFRPDLNDDLWIAPGDAGWGWQDDLDGYLYPIGPGGTNPRAQLTAGQWQTVELHIDQIGATYEAYVDGVKDEERTPASIGTATLMDVMYWDLTSTPWIAPQTPPYASYPVDAGNHARSPVMGPDGKIYYFNSGDGKLVALKPTGPALCAGDLNCDGIVNYSDIDPFVAALSCVGGAPGCWPPPSGTPYVAPGCPWLNGDCDGDGNVTYADIDAFVGRIGATCP